jgi:hypothetical protein
MEGNSMKKPFNTNLRRRSFISCSVSFALSGLLLAPGCSRLINRGQSPDDVAEIEALKDRSTDGPQYVSDTCHMWGMDYAKAEGIGIALNLDGTGSPANPGSYRKQLYEELRRHKDEIDNCRDLCKSKNTEVVILRGYIPPGARKGDHYDIEVEMAPGMEGTSLFDGYAFRTRLRPLAMFGRNRLQQGLVVGVAEGPILVDSVFESRNAKTNNLKGWILGGGEALENRLLGLAIRTENYGPGTTSKICKAINARFKALTPDGRVDIATIPRSFERVDLLLPEVYRDNVRRFSDVIANVRYNESAKQRANRLDELAIQMTDPTTCTKAALRLEAIGKSAYPTLRRSLNNPDLQIRFRAAEALTYCGESDGLAVLKEAAEIEPAFRWHALAALSASRDKDAAQHLENLMQTKSAETRYGAFRALHTRSPGHPAVYGQRFEDFFLHTVASEVEPMVHFSRSKRPEIVIFGNPKVADDFLFVETGLTIRSAGEGQLKLVNYSKDHGREETTCSNELKDLVEVLSAHEFSYGKILGICQAARDQKTLGCRLVVNAVPSAKRRYDSDDLEMEKSSRFPTETPPELFRNGRDKPKRKIARVSGEVVGENLETEIDAVEKDSAWDKMKGLFSRDSDSLIP